MRCLVFLLAAVLAIGQAEAQCEGSVTLVIDVSENARTGSAATPGSNGYELLRAAVLNMAERLSLTSAQIRIISYTGNLPNPVDAQVSYSLSPASVLAADLRNPSKGPFIIPDANLTNFGQSTGGSFTYTGLRVITNWPGGFPQSPGEQILGLISVGGSPARLGLARSEMEAIANANLFDDFRYIYIQDVENPPVEMAQLAAVSGGQQIHLKSYTDLTGALTSIADSLCQAHPCAKCRFESGTYITEDLETCSRYTHCTGRDPDTQEYLSHTFECGPGTLYHSQYHVCVPPADYNCNAWGGRCDDTKAGQTFPHLCCRKYWRCDGEGSVSLHVCPGTQIYDNNTKACRNRLPEDATCLQHERCRCVGTDTIGDLYPHDCCNKYWQCNGNERTTEEECPVNQVFRAGSCVTDVVQYQSCNNDRTCGKKDCQFGEVPGDPCKYREAGFERNVAPGTYFEKDNCSFPAGSCKYPPATVNFFGDCRAFLHTDFNTGFVVVDESRLGVNNTFVHVNPNSIVTANGAAQFTGIEGAYADNIFFPFFSGNIPSSFAMRISVRIADTSPQNGMEYVLISNDRCGECDSTVRLTATYQQNVNQWAITFFVRSSEGDTARITANIFSVNNMFTVENVVEPGAITGTVTLQGQIALPMSGVNTFSGVVASQECGLSLGQGVTSSGTLVALNGEIDDFKVYRGCDDYSRLV